MDEESRRRGGGGGAAGPPGPHGMEHGGAPPPHAAGPNSALMPKVAMFTGLGLCGSGILLLVSGIITGFGAGWMIGGFALIVVGAAVAGDAGKVLRKRRPGPIDLGVATVEARPKKHEAFISFRTNPDQGKAHWLFDGLKRAGVDAVELHGGRLCPYKETEPREAVAWIKSFLRAHVGRAGALLVVTSEQALASRWVLIEYLAGVHLTRAVFLLWFDGPDPTPWFVPSPSPLWRRLPSRPVFLVDMRPNPARGLAVLTDVVRDLGAARRRGLTGQALFAAAAVAVACLPPFAPPDFAGELNVPHAQLGLLVRPWLGLCAVVAAVLMPTGLRLSRDARHSGIVRRLVPGYGFTRYMLLATGVFQFVPFTGVPVLDSLFQSVWLILGYIILSVSLPWLRWLQVRLALRRFPPADTPGVGRQ